MAYNSCDYCLSNNNCSYEKFSEECQSIRNICEFCANHCQDDTIYEMSDWDGGIGFDYIRHIKYCPICGRELQIE